MYFCNEEIELAQLFKAYGYPWEPATGHFVLDQSNLIECPSPFQDRVYFILDLKHFLRRSGTLENLKTRMCWLPTWEQARQILDELGVSAGDVTQRLVETDALVSGSERLELYRMVEEAMTGALTS